MNVTVRLLVLVATLLVASPAAAWADPAGPTNYRSVVTDVVMGSVERDQVPADLADNEPAAGVEARVIGGDSFLQLTVDPGVEVVVFGYDDTDSARDLYLQFGRDGAVVVNQRSEATWINEDRYGETDVPPGVGAGTPPAWVPVASGGEFSWHDHRIHFMSRGLPVGVDPSGGPQAAFDGGWAVPIEINGEPASIIGTLTWLPPASPLGIAPAVLIGLAVGALAAFRGTRPGAVVVGVVGAIGLTVGALTLFTAPTGVDVNVALQLAAPLAVVVLAGAAWGGTTSSVGATALAGAALIGITALQSQSLTAPIVPGPLPSGMARLLVGLTGATGLGIVAGIVARVFTTPLVEQAPQTGSSASVADVRTNREPAG